jgi:quercetin dioxygenase-like cupin family protein
VAGNDPTFFHLDEVPWPDATELDATGLDATGLDASHGGGRATTPAPPAELVEAARASGARRKFLATGEGGFHSQYSELPSGFTVPLHSHDHNEMIVILDGSVTMLGDGPTLGPRDSIVLIGGSEYGFTAGPEGMKFLTIRTGAATTTLK